VLFSLRYVCPHKKTRTAFFSEEAGEFFSAFLTVQGVVENCETGRAAPRHPREKTRGFAELRSDLSDERVGFGGKLLQIVSRPRKISVERRAAHGRRRERIARLRKGEARFLESPEDGGRCRGLGKAHHQKVERAQSVFAELQRPSFLPDSGNPGRARIEKEGYVRSEQGRFLVQLVGLDLLIGEKPGEKCPGVRGPSS
jgi:hypothetical protein